MNYMEEKKLYEVARAMTEEDAMIFLQVFLVEKGLYPKFIEGKAPHEVSAIMNPSLANEFISADNLDDIALKIGNSISCPKCPFKLANKCPGNVTSTCVNCWKEWLRSMLYGA